MKRLMWILVLAMILGIVVGCTQNTSENEKEKNDNLIEQNMSGELENGELNIESGSNEEFISSGEEEKVEVQEVEVTPVVSTDLPNTVCAWGFVRKKDEVQPEIYGPYSKVLDKYNGIYIGNKEDKKIYLTFDEGYENGYSDDILDTLKEKNVKAAFFVTMPYVKQNKELIQRMIDEGHIVGNHISRTSMYHIKIS